MFASAPAMLSHLIIAFIGLNIVGAKQMMQKLVKPAYNVQPPIFKETFSSITLVPGTFVSLKCIATGNPLPQITWTMDDGPVPESSRIAVGDFVTTISEVVSFVNISGVQVGDGGVYSCSANNDVRRTSFAGRVNVIGAPVVRPMKDRTAVEGAPLEVQCPYGGYPIDEIYWEHNNRKIPYNHRQRSFPNGTLLIDVVDKRSDAGDYRCIVKSNQNTGLRAASSMRITVQSPPVIEPFAFPRFIEEGSRAKALCSIIKGDPPISIKWLKDGRPLTSSGVNGISVTFLDEFSAAIVFSKVSLLNRGNYTCVASNMVASTNSSAEAIVHAHPRWTVEPQNTAAVTGRETMIHCQSDGFPEPLVEWKRASNSSRNSPYKTITGDGRLHRLENGSLEIRSVDKTDAGFYMCQASNGIGAGISAVVELQVRTPAHFLDEFKVETVRKGSAMSVKCQALGDKPLTVHWKKDGQPFAVGSDKRYQIRETITDEGISSQLQVDAADRRDSSLYTCTASNGFGSDETNLQVIVQERPDAPAKATIAKVDSRSITVSWSPPYSGNSPILYYIIEFKEVTDEWEPHGKRQRVPGTESKAVVSGLWPGTAYHFRLLAENSLGKSETGVTLHAITELEVPSEAPSDVSAEAVGSKSIRVKWKPGLSMRHRNHVKGYYIGYKGVHSEDVFTYKTVEVTNQVGPYDTVISSLERLTKYILVVKAFNRKGSGPPSDEVLVKTNDMDVPSAPALELISATHKSIELKWEISDASKSVLGFTIYRKEETGSWEEFAVNSDLRTYTFRDLLCGTKYQMYISAHNEAGNGLPSNTIATKTHGTVPIAPAQGAFLRGNGTSSLLHFNEWQPGGCPIKYFVIQYRSDLNREWQALSQPIPGDQDRYLIRDLRMETWYRLRVSAHNEAGTTEAEYTFSTSASDRINSMAQPGWSISDEDVQWINIVLFPVLATIIIVGCVGIVIYGFKRKPRHLEHDGNASIKESMSYSEQVQMSELTLKQSRTNLYDKGVSTPKECLYFPSALEAVSGEQCLQLREAHMPEHRDLYASNTLAVGDMRDSDGVGFASGSGTTFRGNPGASCESERTYEVPFMMTKPKSAARSFQATSGAETLYSYPARSQPSQHQVTKAGNNVVVRLWPKAGNNDYESVRAHYGSVSSMRNFEERPERTWDG